MDVRHFGQRPAGGIPCPVFLRSRKDRAPGEGPNGQGGRAEAGGRRPQGLVEAKARADAEKRAADRAAEEAKKESEKLARWEEDGRKIQEATDKFTTEADSSAKTAAELEVKLSTLRAAKEKLNREAFEFAKQVEMGKISRRSAEIEIQRTVEMIARRAAESTLSRMPAIATPPPSS